MRETGTLGVRHHAQRLVVLARLDDFRGASRFTTWVYKFALLEAAVKLRKRSWQGREVPLQPETWSLFASAGIAPDDGTVAGDRAGVGRFGERRNAWPGILARRGRQPEGARAQVIATEFAKFGALRTIVCDALNLASHSPDTLAPQRPASRTAA